MLGSHGLLPNSFANATRSPRIRKGAPPFENSSSSFNARAPDPTTINSLATTSSISQTTKPLTVQLPNSIPSSSVVHHLGSPSSASFSPDPSDPSSTSPAPTSLSSQKPVVASSKKQKLLKRCHRQLKRLLRTSGTASASSGPTADTCEKCHNCLMNNSILIELQSKYSDLSQEVASLQRQLTAVQTAFTSLRTMLLASFLPSQNNRTNCSDTKTQFDVSPLSNSSDACNPTSSSIATLNDYKQISCTTSVSTALSITAAESNPREHGSVVSASSSAHDLNSLSLRFADPVRSSAVEVSTSPINFGFLPSEANPPYIQSVISNGLHNGVPASYSDKDSSPSSTVESTVTRLGSSVFLQAVRDRMKLLNLTQRTLGRELLGVNEKTLGDVLRKPKPWHQLTPHARSIYERLFIWLNKETHSDFAKEPSSPSSTSNCAVPGKQSSMRDGAPPWVQGDPADTPSTEQALEELCTQTEPNASSPTEAYPSPNSFTSAPPSGSDFMVGQGLSHRRPREMLRTISSASDPVPHDTTSDSGCQHDSAPRKFPSNLDQETQKRIRDILTQARLAMALEKSDDALNRVEHGQRRRKRAASTESENCSKRVLLTNDNIKPVTSQAHTLDAKCDENCLQVPKTSVSTEAVTTQSCESSPPPAVSTVLSFPMAVSNASDLTYTPASSSYLPIPETEGSSATAHITTYQNKQTPVSLAALQLNHIPNTTFGSAATHHSENVHLPQFTTPLAAFSLNTATPPISPNSFPSSNSLYSSSSIPLTPQMTLTVPHSLLPGLVQITAPTAIEPSTSTRPAISSLQQALLLLAAASAARGHGQTINNAMSLPNAFLSQNTYGSIAVSPTSLTTTLTDNAIDTPCFSAVGTSYNLGFVKPEDHGSIDTVLGSAELSSLLSSTIGRSSQSLSTEKSYTPDDATMKIFSELNLHQLTSCQLKQLSDCLPPLNTFDLSHQIRNHLRDLNVSQRLFGDFVLGLSQASVSDLLNKPRSWDQLSPKAKLAYVRLYTWLQQPDRIASLKQMQLIHRQRYLYPIPESSALDSSGYAFLDPSSDLHYTESSQLRNHDDAYQLSLPPTPVSALRQEPFQPEYLNEPNASSDQLTELDRQSLFDIARAAAAAMQRANNPGSTGKLARARAQNDSPMKSTIPSRSVTPLKSDPSSKNASTPVEGCCVNSATISPTKLSPARNRIVFTDAQKEALVTTFNQQPYPHSDRLRELAKQLDLSYKTVLNWFHNRRMRSRQPLTSTDRDGPDIQHSTNQQDPVQRVFSDSRFFNGNGPTCSVSTVSHSDTLALDCESTSLRSVRSNSQSGHSNRRKRPDPARLITPCL